MKALGFVKLCFATDLAYYFTRPNRVVLVTETGRKFVTFRPVVYFMALFMTAGPHSLFVCVHIPRGVLCLKRLE